MPENSTHKCTNAVNNVQPIRNLSHMAKILSVCNRLQAGDYENGNGGKRKGKSTYSVYPRNASITREHTASVSDSRAFYNQPNAVFGGLCLLTGQQIGSCALTSATPGD